MAGFRGYGHLDRHAQELTQEILLAEVERIGHGHGEAALPEVDGNGAKTFGQPGAEGGDGRGRQFDRGGIDIFHPELFGQGSRDLFLRRGALFHQDGAQRPFCPSLLRQSEIQLPDGNRTPPEQN